LFTIYIAALEGNSSVQCWHGIIHKQKHVTGNEVFKWSFLWLAELSYITIRQFELWVLGIVAGHFVSEESCIHFSSPVCVMLIHTFSCSFVLTS